MLAESLLQASREEEPFDGVEGPEVRGHFQVDDRGHRASAAALRLMTQRQRLSRAAGDEGREMGSEEKGEP